MGFIFNILAWVARYPMSPLLPQTTLSLPLTLRRSAAHFLSSSPLFPHCCYLSPAIMSFLPARSLSPYFTVTLTPSLLWPSVRISHSHPELLQCEDEF